MSVGISKRLEIYQINKYAPIFTPRDFYFIRHPLKLTSEFLTFEKCLLWSDVSIGRDRLVRAVLCCVVIFLATRATALLTLLLGLFNNNDLFFLFLLYLFDDLKLCAGASVVSGLPAGSAFTHCLSLSRV
jgi:hypothetical protein